MPTYPNPLYFLSSDFNIYAKPIPLVYPKAISQKNTGIPNMNKIVKYGNRNAPPPFLYTTFYLNIY